MNLKEIEFEKVRTDLKCVRKRYNREVSWIWL